ncbi:MAG: substrate-binding domain-containing protein, partial [Staphylococcus equorum]|nr:substrate-binding domain-containing protein [Staphylococcus equorum]
ATNDEMAIGIMRGLADKGVRVPHDISVIGFDDIDIAKYLVPSLTTVAQPIKEIGESALALITHKLIQNDATLHNVALHNELIIRETTQYFKK